MDLTRGDFATAGAAASVGPPQYTRVAIAFHWTIAAIIIAELAVGMVMERIPDRHVRIPIVQLHASFGVLVLWLSLARIAWRLAHRPPPFDPGVRAWEAHTAHAVHVLLYAGMILMPMIGWSILSTSTRALKAGVFLFFTPLRWPALPLISRTPEPRLDALHDQFVQLHTIGGFIMIGLLLAHVGGALKHQWLDGQPQFRRIWFARGAGGRA